MLSLSKLLWNKTSCSRGGQTTVRKPHAALEILVCGSLSFSKIYIFVFIFYFYCKGQKNCRMVVATSVPYSINFASRSKLKYDVTEALLANEFVFLDICIATLCYLGFTIYGSYIRQVWPPLPYSFQQRIAKTLFRRQNSHSSLSCVL